MIRVVTNFTSSHVNRPTLLASANQPDDVAERNSQRNSITHSQLPTFVSDTSSHEKRREFGTYFSGTIPGGVLPFMARPADPELEGSAQGNAAAKSEHAGKLSKIPSWLMIAEILAAKGVIAQDIALDLRIWVESQGKTRLANYRQPALTRVTPFRNEEAIWNYLRAQAVALGQELAYDRMVTTPLYVLTDDSQTQMWLAQKGKKTPLSFGLLDKVIKEIEVRPELAKKHRDVLVLRDGIRSVAAHLQAARAYKQLQSGKPASDPYISLPEAWDYYIRELADYALLGVDGAPIASVLGPEKTLQGLHALANYFGASISDIQVNSESNVNATLVRAHYDSNYFKKFSSRAFATFRFLPWNEIQRMIVQGNIGVHLSHVLVVNPDAPPNQQRTVIESIKEASASSVTARGKALLALREQMSVAGISLPIIGATQQTLRPLDQNDTVRIVIPDQITERQKKGIGQKVGAAWRFADPRNNPHIEFVRLGDVAHDPDISWKLLGSSAVFLVDPSMYGGSPNDRMNFVRLTKDFEINGTVGEPVHGQTPTFVIGDSNDSKTGAGIAHHAMGSLYVHGRAPNPIESIFSSWNDLHQVVTKYWQSATVRPSDSNLPRTSSSLAEPLNKENEVVFALYGSAKEYVDPKYPAQVRALMNAAVEAHAVKNDNGQVVREPFSVSGTDLMALGKRLGVLVPPDLSAAPIREDYHRRLDAGLRMMPGVVVAERTALDDGHQRYVLHVPVMRRPVVFSHGGGVSPFDARRPDDPTINIMGAFNGIYVGRIQGDKSIQLIPGSSRGISTLPLMHKEGRPEALLPTNEYIITDHIQQRTLETQRGAHVAFATYGGIGTEQEKLYFPGVMVLLEGNNFSNRRIAQLRASAELKTIILEPKDPHYAEKLGAILEAAPKLDPKNKEFEQRYADLISELDSRETGDFTAGIGGGSVIEPTEIIGTPEQRRRLERLLGSNAATTAPPDRSPQRLAEAMRKPPQGNANRIDLPAHTGHGERPEVKLLQTTAHDPQANKYEPITVLIQAISLLRSTDNPPALAQQWAQSNTLMLRALLTQDGLKQVLRYGLGGTLVTALSHGGLSRYLSSYRTRELLQTISRKEPTLASVAQAMRTQVLNVLVARGEALAPTTVQRARVASQPFQQLQRAMQGLQQAITPVQRSQALQQFQAVLTRLNPALTVARNGQQLEHQATYELMQKQLQQITAFLPNQEDALNTALSMLGGLVWALRPLLQRQRI